MIPIYDAIELITKQVYRKKFEIVPIEQGVGRVSCEELKATLPLPSFDNSAMDGYAVKFCDEGQEVEIIGKILAGDEYDDELISTKTINIMTGAVVPVGSEAIVPQEDIQKLLDKKILLPTKIIKTNIRKKGEDINIGEIILEVGDKINSFKIAILASQGISHLKVYKKPIVTVFASGAELKLHYEKINKSQIYNSNTPALLARAEELGCQVRFIGKAEDNIESIKQLVFNSLDSDLIVTSGGVSVGDADFTKEAFTECGFREIFCKVDIKPGKPTVFGKIKDTFILNLPGNPLASSLNFEVFGTVIVSKLLGQNGIYPNFITTKISTTFNHKQGKNSVIPGNFDGKDFTIAKQFAPGMVNVLNHCNGFILIDKSVSILKKGDEVKFIPTTWQYRSDKFIDIFTKES